MTDKDRAFLRDAARYACHGIGHTRPNPPVGAVVVRGDTLISGGWHAHAGGDHAEVAAIKNAGAEACRGATLYVTLEPCSRPGRVGACTDAIIAAGFARVVYGVSDPNPTNANRAATLLRERGIACEPFEAVAPSDPLLATLRALIAPFAKHVRTGLPFMTVKLAMSLDGRICDREGRANWISNEDDRRRTGLLRRAADAIMVGAETVRRDNPSLLWHGGRNDDLLRVVISKSGDLPKDARLFTDGAPNETLVFADPRTAIEELGRRGAMHVLCEGGLALATSLGEQGLVDDWLTVLAPCVIGSRPIAEKIALAQQSAFVNPTGVALNLLALLESKHQPFQLERTEQ